MRFLWWEHGDPRLEVEELEMCVHLFGDKSSPTCSNYALKRTSVDYQIDFGEDAAKTLRKNFYVDDMLKSSPDAETAIDLISRVRRLCAAGGFNLTKFVSNNVEVMQAIPDEHVNLKHLEKAKSQSEKALGLVWNIDTTTFGYKFSMQDKPLSKRGILSELSSVYDPLGFVAPFLLHGRKIIQILSQQELGWDKIVSDEVAKDWVELKSKLPALENLAISRCIKPAGFGKIKRSSICHFLDASEGGYGQSSYLRLEDDQGKIHCVLLIGKSKVSPLKFVSIPRLELIAAILSVKVSLLLRQELGIPIKKEYFWTDSKVVLGYINNSSKIFLIFVANRIQFIRENADPKQWFYVLTKENPADDSSRGLKDVNSNSKQKDGLRVLDFYGNQGVNSPHKFLWMLMAVIQK